MDTKPPAYDSVPPSAGPTTNGAGDTQDETKKHPQEKLTSLPVVSQPNTITIVMREFGEEPVQMVCPQCGSEVVSATQDVVGTYTYLNVAICCIFFGICGLIPCCMKSCKDVEHTCPHCDYHLGVYKRSCN